MDCLVKLSLQRNHISNMDFTESSWCAFFPYRFHSANALLTYRFMSPLSHLCHLPCPPHVWLCSILYPRCSSRRPRLEVLNVSQNRIQRVTGLHLLPSLVVLNLGKCLCLHELVGGPGASVMRSPQRRPFATAPQRCPVHDRLCYYSF
jgi:hypothetical protein